MDLIDADVGGLDSSGRELQKLLRREEVDDEELEGGGDGGADDESVYDDDDMDEDDLDDDYLDNMVRSHGGFHCFVGEYDGECDLYVTCPPIRVLCPRLVIEPGS